MMLFLLFFPALIIFLLSFSKSQKIKKILPLTSLTILLPIILLFLADKPYQLLDDYLIVDKLNSYILLVSSIVGIGVTLSLITLDKRVIITPSNYRRFYRFFGLFWIGLIISILSNNMGIYWVGLEMATLSTVYMIKTNNIPSARLQTWSYLIVGAIAISLILFGIILIYASAKPNLGEDAMNFNILLSSVHSIKNQFLFDIGFSIVIVGMFIKMGFFPMNLWLANIERASFYPVAALFSGILESAILIGFFRFSQIAMEINQSKIFIFTLIYMILTIFVVAFLIYRTKDFMRLFSLSGVEHMALIVLFWIAGSPFAALLHFGAHAFLKPALFLSTGILESHGRYHIAGALKGYHGISGKLFAICVTLFLLGIISLPPSPMFFSELYGFGAIIAFAKHTDTMLVSIGAILLLLILISIIFYKFVAVFQSMKYEGEEEDKIIYKNEIFAMLIFTLSLIILLLPWSFEYLRGIL